MSEIMKMIDERERQKKTKTERRIMYYLKSVYSQLTEWTLKRKIIPRVKKNFFLFALVTTTP